MSKTKILQTKRPKLDLLKPIGINFIGLTLGFFSMTLAVSAEKTEPKTVPATESAAPSGEETKQTTYRTPRESYGLTYLGLGPHFGTRLGSQGVIYGAGLGRFWQVHEHAEVRALASAGLGGANSSFYLTATGGFGYFFLTDDVAPYVGGDFGAGIMDSKSVAAGMGFITSAFAGIRLFRTADIQIDLLFRYQWLLRSNELGNPSVYGFQFGLFL